MLRDVERLRGEDGKLISFAWPGGYPVQYYTKDGLTVCPECANRDVDQSQEVVGGDVYWEGPPTPCEDCGELIESAYGDPEEK